MLECLASAVDQAHTRWGSYAASGFVVGNGELRAGASTIKMRKSYGANPVIIKMKGFVSGRPVAIVS